MKKYGTGDGRILRDEKQKTAKEEFTEKDRQELAEEQADVLEDEDA
jgi:hypothetical protein